MAQLHYVESARSDKKGRGCHRCAKPIKKGDGYYWVARRVGGTLLTIYFCSDHRPRPSQITCLGVSQLLWV